MVLAPESVAAAPPMRPDTCARRPHNAPDISKAAAVRSIDVIFIFKLLLLPSLSRINEQLPHHHPGKVDKII
jgi:hypothetical protein